MPAKQKAVVEQQTLNTPTCTGGSLIVDRK